MSEEKDEAMLRLEEIIGHPTNPTYSSLLDQERATKKELSRERHDLAQLLAALPSKAPKKGTKAFDSYQKTLKQIQVLKVSISKKHDELMDILKNEERISREIQGDK
ncbi:MAG: hypothetical protein JSS32_04015 [Verrucomicrobia bacterium]|nr:hypothetical protein [Verrucomicrobiota bacterium]